MKISADRVIEHICGYIKNTWFYEVESGEFQNAVYLAFEDTELLVTSNGVMPLEGLEVSENEDVEIPANPIIKVFQKDFENGLWKDLIEVGSWNEILSKILFLNGPDDIQFSNCAKVILIKGEVAQAITPIVILENERSCVCYPQLLKTA